MTATHAVRAQRGRKLRHPRPGAGAGGWGNIYLAFAARQAGTANCHGA